MRVIGGLLVAFAGVGMVSGSYANCVCVGSIPVCHGTLWEALETVTTDSSVYEKTIVVEGECLGVRENDRPTLINLKGNVTIQRDDNHPGKASLVFHNPVAIRILNQLTIIGVELLTPVDFPHRGNVYPADMNVNNKVDLFVGEKSIHGTGDALLTLKKSEKNNFRSSLNGMFKITVEIRGKLYGEDTDFLGSPSIVNVVPAPGQSYPVGKMGMEFTGCSFMRNIVYNLSDRANPLSFGCVAGAYLRFDTCDFLRGFKIDACECGHQIRVTRSVINLPVKWSDPFLRVSSCSTEIGKRQVDKATGFVVFDALKFSRQANGESSLDFSSPVIRLDLQGKGPLVTVTNTNYVGLQTAATQNVGGNAFHFRLGIDEEYTGKVKHGVYDYHDGMVYNRQEGDKQIGAHMVCFNNSAVNKVFELDTPEAFRLKYNYKYRVYGCDSKGILTTSLANEDEYQTNVMLIYRNFNIVDEARLIRKYPLVPIRKVDIPTNTTKLLSWFPQNEMFARLVSVRGWHEFTVRHVEAFNWLFTNGGVPKYSIRGASVILGTRQRGNLGKVIGANTAKAKEYMEKYTFPGFHFTKREINDSLLVAAYDCEYASGFVKHSTGRFCIENLKGDRVQFYVYDGSTSGSEPVSDAYNEYQIFMVPNPLIEVFGMEGDTNKPVMLYQLYEKGNENDLHIIYASKAATSFPMGAASLLAAAILRLVF